MEEELPTEFDLEMEHSVTKLQAAARGRMARKEMMESKNLTDEQKAKLEAAQGQTEAQRDFFKDVQKLLGVSKEVYNSSAGLQQAHQYMEQQQIPLLLDSLLARVALERPVDTRKFLISVLKDMKSGGKPGDVGLRGLLTEQDLETIFSMYDELQEGVIAPEKVAFPSTSLQVYFRQDDTFNLPKAVIQVMLYCPWAAEHLERRPASKKRKRNSIQLFTWPR